MRRIVCLGVAALSLFASIFADEVPLTINAIKADYADRLITLEGDVVVEHELGKMAAQQVVIRPVPNEKRLQLGSISLKDKVNLRLSDGGQLSCARADLDYVDMKGVFGGEVIYSELCKGKKQETVPLVVKSASMELELAEAEEGESGSSRSYVRRITALGDVNVNYNYDFIANADRGEYQRREGVSGGQPEGTVKLSMVGPDRQCKVVNRNGDRINAVVIAIDTLTKELIFDEATGTIVDGGSRNSSAKGVDFSADTLVWNMASDRIFLRDNVHIDQAGLGSLSTAGEVRISQQVHAGKKQLSTLETEGKTVIVFKVADGKAHTLTSYGLVTVDHIQLCTTMNSPKNSKGRVRGDDQVSFVDSQGEVCADKAVLSYAVIDDKVVLSKVKLEGNVRLRDHHGENGDTLHYTVADFVEYNPQAKEMIFTAKAKRRVLFYDKVNNLQISAPALKISRDAVTDKESIKGIGDVRFSFIDQEYAQLRNKFKLDPTEAVQP